MKLPIADQEMDGIARRLLLDQERLFKADKRRIVDVDGRFRRDRALDENTRLVNGIELMGALIALGLVTPIFSVSIFRLTTRVREPWLTATTPLAASVPIALARSHG